MALYLDAPIEGVVVDVKERSGIVEFVLHDKEGLARVAREGFRLNGVPMPQHLPLTKSLSVGQTVDLVNLKVNRCNTDEEKGIFFYADAHLINPPFIKKIASGLPTQYYNFAGSDIDKTEDTRSWKDDASLEESFNTEKTSSSTNDLLSISNSSRTSVRGIIEPPALSDTEGTQGRFWKIHAIPKKSLAIPNNTLPAEKVTFDKGTQTISTGEIISFGIYPGV